jgi:hypothetical protein
MQFLEWFQVCNRYINFSQESQENPMEGTSATQNDIQEEEDTQLLTDSEEREQTPPRTSKKRNKFEEALLKMLEENKEREDDEDQAFLKSILPTLKIFNNDKKYSSFDQKY